MLLIKIMNNPLKTNQVLGPRHLLRAKGVNRAACGAEDRGAFMTGPGKKKHETAFLSDRIGQDEKVASLVCMKVKLEPVGPVTKPRQTIGDLLESLHPGTRSTGSRKGSRHCLSLLDGKNKPLYSRGWSMGQSLEKT